MAGKHENTTTVFNTYLSHSYRSGDVELNRKYWSVFAENNFSFLVDARSDYFSLLYLETMMRRSHCFVAVVPARTGQPGYSPYIKFEFDMARLARKPRFVVRSADADADAFPVLPRDMQQEFDQSIPDNCLPELEHQVREFRQRVMAQGAQAVSRSHHLGVLLASGRAKRPPAFAEIRERLREVGGAHNYTVDVLDPEQLDYGDLAKLDRYDLLVIDASGHYVPPDIFGFAHSRLIPTIKLVPLREGDFPRTVKLPTVSARLRDTPTDPLIYWRNPEELILAVDRELTGLERLTADDLQRTKTAQDAARYFSSLGRARLRVFLSNASEDGELALAVAEALRTRYIDLFHYKDPRDLRAGVNWRLQVAREVTQECGIFVMLSSEHYWGSSYCYQEFQAAKTRQARGEMVILPFQVGSGRMDRLGDIQTSDMTQTRYHHLKPPSLADEIADLIVEQMSLEGRQKDGLISAERIASLHAEAVDVSPEAVIGGGDESLPVQWLLDAYQACRSIARVRVSGIRSGKPMVSKGVQRSWYSTGWLIDEGILVTNYHVVAGTDREGRTEEDVSQQAMGMHARFGFTERHSETRQFRVDEVLAANQDLDYAVVRLHRFAEDKQPGLDDSQLPELDPVSTIEFWGRLEMQPARTLTTGDRLNVVQHPGGGEMMVAFRRNTFSGFSLDDRTIEYSTDTREGSSGSPVFDDNWIVRALHSHAIMAPGPDGTGRLAAANGGIPIEAIIADLGSRHGLRIVMRRRAVATFELETARSRNG
jgi:V8-like Glu-specific endopeptidase